ncbi:hypothetical protein [Guyparkeria sp.]|uniref:hypothetical protein n=1 Tax=Guyparkeria sp. TaxID=2035736 RepID=UPI00356456F4
MKVFLADLEQSSHHVGKIVTFRLQPCTDQRFEHYQAAIGVGRTRFSRQGASRAMPFELAIQDAFPGLANGRPVPDQLPGAHGKLPMAAPQRPAKDDGQNDEAGEQLRGDDSPLGAQEI